MLKSILLLLFITCSMYLYSPHINAMHNGKKEHNNNIIIDSNKQTLNIPEYEPFDPDFLYNKDFLENPEALKVAKKEAITLRLQQKYTESLPYLEEAIKHGDLQSMIWLGEYYEKEEDLLKAIQWYVLAFQLHWLETFKHHPTILIKFQAIKEKYTSITHNNKNKNSTYVNFNDNFYELKTNNRKELKQFLCELATPGSINFLHFYRINLDESEFDNYLNDINTYIAENKDTIKFKHIKKIFQKIKQTLFQKKIKIYSKSDDIFTLESKNYISELHHELGLQYYCSHILNINNTPNYTKAAEHFLLSQNADAHDILYDLYLHKDVNFQNILNNSENYQSHEKAHNVIDELSIQENIDFYYERMSNKFKESNHISTIVMILSLYHSNKIGKKLNDTRKEEEILRLKNKALHILSQGIVYNTDYFFRGYTYYFTNEYENARTNFLLALENKVGFDTSIISLIDAHIESQENIKHIEELKNEETLSKFTSEYTINNLNTNDDTFANPTKESSIEDSSSNTINELSNKTIVTKELKQKLKHDRIKYKIQKNYENIKKHQKIFEEKQKKHGVCLNENITHEFKNRKILFSSDNKPLSNKQKEIKQQYEYLINESNKFQRLIQDVKINPWSGGEGQVEHLKRRGSYSRRINHCDRLEYRVNSDGDIVILAVEGHYDT
jgi:Txe/YoeB family toxin of Txe-Axe toxin-antitoxin module